MKKLALIGPHANGSVIFLGGPNYHGDNDLVSSNTPLLRAQAKLPGATVTYTEGCTVKCSSSSGFAAATAAAKEADTVVLFLGLDDTIENEGHDRVSLELPGQQMDLATALELSGDVTDFIAHVEAAEQREQACNGIVGVIENAQQLDAALLLQRMLDVAREDLQSLGATTA